MVRPTRPATLSELKDSLDAITTSGKRMDVGRARELYHRLSELRQQFGPEGSLAAQEAEAFRDAMRNVLIPENPEATEE